MIITKGGEAKTCQCVRAHVHHLEIFSLFFMASGSEDFCDVGKGNVPFRYSEISIYIYSEFLQL